jgi:hypothetical protein
MSTSQYNNKVEINGFGPNGSVILSDGIIKKVKDLKVKDKVESLKGFSTINKVVKYSKEIQQICNLNNALITYKNSIHYSNKWIYTNDICNVYISEVELYNFEMDGDKNENLKHSIVINDIGCATIGCDHEVVKLNNLDKSNIRRSGFCKI